MITRPITYSKKGSKYVFNKGGMYFTLTLEQVDELKGLLREIEQEVLDAVPMRWV